MRCAVGLASFVASAALVGCSLAHGRGDAAGRDADGADGADAGGLDSGQDSGALRDAASDAAQADARVPPACSVECGAPEVVAAWSPAADTAALSLLGAVASGERVAVLVALESTGGATHRLVVFDPTGSVALSADAESVHTVADTFIAGVRGGEGGFGVVAITNETLRCTRTLALGTATFLPSGELGHTSRAAFAGPVSTLPGCDWLIAPAGGVWSAEATKVAIVLDGLVSEVTSDTAGVRVARGPRIAEVASQPVPATIVRGAGIVAVAGGGLGRFGGALPAFVTAGDTVETSTRFEIEGTASDPRPALALARGRPHVARFVSDAADPARSAIRVWPISSSGPGAEVVRVESRAGLAPIGLAFAADGDAVVWASPDPVRIGEADVHVALLGEPGGESCSAPAPPPVAHLPNPLVGEFPLAAVGRDPLYVAVLELGVPGRPERVSLLRLRACRSATP